MRRIVLALLIFILGSRTPRVEPLAYLREKIQAYTGQHLDDGEGPNGGPDGAY